MKLVKRFLQSYNGTLVSGKLEFGKIYKIVKSSQLITFSNLIQLIVQCSANNVIDKCRYKFTKDPYLIRPVAHAVCTGAKPDPRYVT